MNENFDLSQLKRLEKIGEGGFGRVYKVQDKKTKKIYAAKVSIDEIDPTNQLEALNLYREVSIISKTHHPAVLGFIGYSPTDFSQDSKPVIITEYSANGSLAHLIKLNMQGISISGYNDTKKLIIIYGIASGMTHLHSNNVIHRDLKAGNILIDDCLCPKIADFGLSKIMHTKTTCVTPNSTIDVKGTPIFIAPEIWTDQKYTQQSDVYAFAFIVYEIMHGLLPPEKVTPYQIMERVVKKKDRPKIDSNIPKSYKKLIEDCWNQNPKKRPLFSQICERLKTDKGFITNGIDKQDFDNYIEFIDEAKKYFDEHQKVIEIDEFIEKNKIQTSSTTTLHKTVVQQKKFKQEKDKINFPKILLSKLSEDNKQLVEEANEDDEKQLKIGVNLIEGTEGFMEKIELGVKYLKASTKSGNIEACKYLSRLLLDAKLLPIDYDKAIKYLSKFLYQKDATVYLLYGKALKMKKEFEQAFKNFQKSAKLGNPEAMYECSLCYTNGLGVAKDVKSGETYLRLAKTNGYVPSKVKKTEFENDESDDDDDKEGEIDFNQNYKKPRKNPIRKKDSDAKLNENALKKRKLSNRKKSESSDGDDEDDDENINAKNRSKIHNKKKKTKEDSEEEEEDESGSSKNKKKKQNKKKIQENSDDDDEENINVKNHPKSQNKKKKQEKSEDDDDDESGKSKNKKKNQNKKKTQESSDNDDDDDDDENTTSKNHTKNPNKKKKAQEDCEEEEEEDDDDESGSSTNKKKIQPKNQNRKKSSYRVQRNNSYKKNTTKEGSDEDDEDATTNNNNNKYHSNSKNTKKPNSKPAYHKPAPQKKKKTSNEDDDENDEDASNNSEEGSTDSHTKSEPRSKSSPLSKVESIWDETQSILKRGFYNVESGKRFYIQKNVLSSIDNTKIYKPEDSFDFDDFIEECESYGNEEKSSIYSKIEVTNESTFSAAKRIKNDGTKEVCCLSFASPIMPGSGINKNAKNQEAVLSRRSSLVLNLVTHDEMYDYNIANLNAYNSNYMIYSPNVVVFRDDDEKLIPFFRVSVISATPVNYADIQKRYKNEKFNVVYDCMKERCRRILQLCIKTNNKAIVLGAFGCGSMKNDPKTVSKIFKELLVDEFYGMKFKNVVFAIMAPPNRENDAYNAFKETFDIENESE